MFCQQPVIKMSSGGRDNGCTPLQRWQPVHAKTLHTSRRCMRTEVSSGLPCLSGKTSHELVVTLVIVYRAFCRCTWQEFLTSIQVSACCHTAPRNHARDQPWGSRRTAAVNHDNQIHPHHYARRPKTILECRWNCDLSWVRVTSIERSYFHVSNWTQRPLI